MVLTSKIANLLVNGLEGLSFDRPIVFYCFQTDGLKIGKHNVTANLKVILLERVLSQFCNILIYRLVRHFV